MASATVELPLSESESAINSLADVLPGDSKSTHPRDRLAAVLATEDAPTAVELYRAWIGPTKVPSLDEAADRVAEDLTGEFDPAEDATPSSSEIRIAEVYEQTREQGFEDAATFLRVLDASHQRNFARFLNRVVFE